MEKIETDVSCTTLRNDFSSFWMLFMLFALPLNFSAGCA